MQKSTTRRAVVSGLAAAPLAALPALALDGPDPAFAAIKRYHDGFALHGANLARSQAIYNRLRDAGHTSRDILRWRNPDIAADCAEMERLGQEGSVAECSAMHALATTVPTTAAGAVALLRTIREGAEQEPHISMGDGIENRDFVLGLFPLETFLAGRVQS